ncbi:class I SAM-dependent methyltransferase [Mucisphaera calidilacus]|uniref:Demethylmenaquinone methyltransferase n=1 Tax=Mucisphaera calidilacus TaxID=2527982 RepID=A0A518BUG0_9BACT|nr:class I SAM-dependent methyltransferase [Mucisphaera calidilacus]QDU70581.1 Demethylmenaquinone methyltransferase [Mucisphaera calidilacus]
MNQPPPEPSITAWEDAYSRFETPAQERAKFRQRLRKLNAHKLPRDARILETFCGRGNGMNAWKDLGFQNIHGLDLSPRLLAQVDGPFQTFEGDACNMPFDDHAYDAVCVQGGLHHLPSSQHLDQCLRETRRVLKPHGYFLVVEPWNTPFLRLVHAMTRSPLRRLWPKLDALAVMIDNERTTYEAWLNAAPRILQNLEQHFVIETKHIARGKIMAVTRPR